MTSIRLTAFFNLLARPPSRKTFRGDISGVVADSNGAAVANAALRVEDPATGLTRSTVTGGTGDYLGAEIPVGPTR